MVKYVVKPISQQNKKSCKRNIYKTFLVGVTGFEHSAAHRRRMVEPRAKHSFASVSPCFGRRNFDKTAHRAVLSLFPLDPEPSKKRFSDTLQPFPPLFAR